MKMWNSLKYNYDKASTLIALQIYQYCNSRGTEPVFHYQVLSLGYYNKKYIAMDDKEVWSLQHGPFHRILVLIDHLPVVLCQHCCASLSADHILLLDCIQLVNFASWQYRRIQLLRWQHCAIQGPWKHWNWIILLLPLSLCIVLVFFTTHSHPTLTFVAAHAVATAKDLY